MNGVKSSWNHSFLLDSLPRAHKNNNFSFEIHILNFPSGLSPCTALVVSRLGISFIGPPSPMLSLLIQERLNGAGVFCTSVKRVCRHDRSLRNATVSRDCICSGGHSLGAPGL